jgi:alpha-maltose-1-phosphate synthase
MFQRREILVLDYSAGSSRGPHALSMYDCLASKYNLSIVSIPLPRFARCMARLATVHPRPAEWSRRYWRKVEAYQHSPAGFRAATNAYSRAAQRLVRRRRVDLILQYGAMFGPVDLPDRIPYLTYHDGNMAITCKGSSHQADFLTGEHFSEWMTLERSLVHQASRVLTYSRRTRDSYVDDYGCRTDRVVAVGSSDWVRRSDAEWLQQRLEAGLENKNPKRDPNTVLFIHTDFSRKGGDVLLKAFQQVQTELPDAKLIVVGPNPELARGRGVCALGIIHDREQLFAFYQRATVFALPSLNDPFPRVVFEAMAHGLPCIGSRVGGIPEQILHERTGLTVEPNDVDALSSAIIGLLRNPDERRAFGLAGIQHLMENFLPESVAGRVGQQIEAVLNG